MRFCIVICAAIFLSAVLLSGCASFEYTGRSFESSGRDAVVAWHTDKNPVPSGVYRVIGRGVLKYKAGVLDMYDVEERLLNEARKRGADAVMIKKVQVSSVGSYDVDNTPDPGSAARTVSSVGVAANGEKLKINALGRETLLSGGDITEEVCTVNAVFYKKAEAVQQLIESSPVRLADGPEDKK